jgi:hypothetical protein
MTATATLVHSSSRANDNAERIARVAAAGRIERARIAAEYRATVDRARAESVATQWVEDIRAAGAVRIGHKWCLSDGGKWRGTVLIEHAADFMARAWGEDIEAWGINAAGEYVGQVW